MCPKFSQIMFQILKNTGIFFQIIENIESVFRLPFDNSCAYFSVVPHFHINTSDMLAYVPLTFLVWRDASALSESNSHSIFLDIMFSCRYPSESPHHHPGLFSLSSSLFGFLFLNLLSLLVTFLWSLFSRRFLR